MVEWEYVSSITCAHQDIIVLLMTEGKEKRIMKQGVNTKFLFVHEQILDFSLYKIPYAEECCAEDTSKVIQNLVKSW